MPASPRVSILADTPLWTICSSGKPLIEAHIVDQENQDCYTGHSPSACISSDGPTEGPATVDCGESDAISVREDPPCSTADLLSRSAIQTPVCLSKHNDMTLTVEEFLRRAATSTKRYNTRRRKKPKAAEVDNFICAGGDSVLDSDPRDLDYHPEDSSSSPLLSRKRHGHRIVWTSDEEEDATEKPPKKRRRRQKKTQPLSARLLAPAVVTGVDVVGGILLPSDSTRTLDAQGSKLRKTRRPLPFLPEHRAPSPAEKSKADRRHFIDPRKTAPFERAQFEFRQDLIVDTSGRTAASHEAKKDVRPITAWKPLNDEAVPRTGYRGEALPQSRTIARTHAERLAVPLKLVPAGDSRSVEQR